MIIKFGGVYCCDGEFIIILLNKENVHSKGSLFGYPMRLLLFRSGQLALNKKIVNRFIPTVEIKKERLAALVTALSGQINTTEYILFNNANLCEEGIVWLSKLVDVSSKLHHFIISHNRIDNMELARCLTSSIRSHNCIAGLTISYCDLGSSPEILSVILQSDVEYINLNNNNIDSLGAVKIAKYLEDDPPLDRLSLDQNRLNDDDVILILQALKKNTELKTLSLHTNNFTSIGVKALLTCVFDGSSLNAISESNHKLIRINMFHNHNDKLAFCTEILLQLDCTQENYDCLARQGFSTPISCKCTCGAHTRGVGISSWTG